MKRTLSVLIAAGFVVAMPAAAMMSSVSALAGHYGGGGSGYSKKTYYPPKKAYTPPPSYSYNGDYPPQNCYGEKTYDPPSGYSQGCEPPTEWVTYCGQKYNSFDDSNGYYLGYDGYYHYCD
jgi:hypothetical protein